MLLYVKFVYDRFNFFIFVKISEVKKTSIPELEIFLQFLILNFYKDYRWFYYVIKIKVSLVIFVEFRLRFSNYSYFYFRMYLIPLSVIYLQLFYFHFFNFNIFFSIFAISFNKLSLIFVLEKFKYSI